MSELPEAIVDHLATLDLRLDEDITQRMADVEWVRDRLTEREAPLRARIAELETRQAKSDTREIDLIAHLGEIFGIAHEHGGEDGGGDGVTCGACHRILALADSALALSDPSPSAQALTRLAEAATNPRLREQVNQLRITFPMDPESGPNTPDDLKDFEALGDLLETGDALQAARSGREEGE